MADRQNDIPTQIQRLAFERGLDHKSDVTRDAETALRSVHRDLPEMAERSIGYLASSGVDVASSRATSHRLASALVRETAIHGSDRMTGMDKNSAMRNAMRTTLVQEAAAGEYEMRSGRRDVLSQFLGDRGPTQAEAAGAALQRQGIDTGKLFAAASLEDTRMMAAGSFSKLSPEQHGNVAKVLEIPVVRTETAIDAEPSRARHVATVTPIRHQAEPVRETFSHAARTPTFGRRNPAALAQMQAIGAGR